MRILGLLFIILGIGLCFTVLLFVPGAIAVGVGALLCIAGKDHTPGPIGKVIHGLLLAGVVVVILGGVGCWVSIHMDQQMRRERKAAAAEQVHQTAPPTKKHAKKAVSPAQ